MQHAALLITLVIAPAVSAKNMQGVDIDTRDYEALEKIAASIKAAPDEFEIIRERESFFPHVKVPGLYERDLKILVHEKRITGLLIMGCKMESTAPAAGLEKLRELYLAKCKLQSIEGLEGPASLKVLNLSGNEIKKIKGLDQLQALERLVLYDNAIKKIEGLENLAGLKELYLTENKIKKIEGLEGLAGLEELYLGGNSIKTIEGLDKLANLRVLVLYANKLKKIQGLEGLSGLEELFLSSNSILKIEGLDHLASLRELHLNSNKLEQIENLDKLASLEVLDLSDNFFKKPSKPLEKLKAKLVRLRDVRLHSPSLALLKEERSALKKAPLNSFVSLKINDYTIKSKFGDKPPEGKSCAWYMKKAETFMDEKEHGRACFHFYSAADKCGGKQGAKAAIAAAFCAMEFQKNSPAAIKQFPCENLTGGQKELVAIGIAEAQRRYGRLKQALRAYVDYLETYPDGKYVVPARAYRKKICKFFQTNSIGESSYHAIRKPDKLLFFELQKTPGGVKYL